MANATTGRERAVSFDSKVVRNLLDDDDDEIMRPPEDDPMAISSSDDEELECWSHRRRKISYLSRQSVEL